MMKRKAESVQAKKAAKKLTAERMAAAKDPKPFVSEAHRRFTASKENLPANCEPKQTPQPLPPLANEKEAAPIKAETPPSPSKVPAEQEQKAKDDPLIVADAGLKRSSILGQGEKLLDPKDAERPPVFTRLVADFNGTGDFFDKNLKVLLNTKNEYYPYIAGPCMCGTCTCGNCRCVHFRARRTEPLPLPTYKADYVAHPPHKVVQRVPQPENIRCPFPFSEHSTYQNDFTAKPSAVSQLVLPVSQQPDTLGQAALRLRAPFANVTSNQIDYPNWCVTRPLDSCAPLKGYAPGSLPFVGQPESREYGKRLAEGGLPAREPKKTAQRSTLSLIGGSAPQDFLTTQRKDFNPSNATLREPLDRKLPPNNILLTKSKFDGQFVPVSADFAAPNQRQPCPLREAALRLRRVLCEYARTHQIPF